MKNTKNSLLYYLDIVRLSFFFVIADGLQFEHVFQLDSTRNNINNLFISICRKNDTFLKHTWNFLKQVLGGVTHNIFPEKDLPPSRTTAGPTKKQYPEAALY